VTTSFPIEKIDTSPAIDFINKAETDLANLSI